MKDMIQLELWQVVETGAAKGSDAGFDVGEFDG